MFIIFHTLNESPAQPMIKQGFYKVLKSLKLKTVFKAFKSIKFSPEVLKKVIFLTAYV